MRSANDRQASHADVCVAALALASCAAQPAAARRRAAAQPRPRPKRRRSRSSRPAARSPARRRASSRTATSPAPFKVEDLIKAVPNLDKLASLSGEQVANIGSQDMNDEVWLKLAKRANELLATTRRRRHRHHARHRHDGGDRVLPDLVVKSDKPVVLVGSMRPATAISADGPANLYNARRGRGEPEARGPRRAGRDQRRDPRRAQRHQDQHHQRRDVREPEPRPGRARAHRQDRAGSSRMDKKHTTRLASSRSRTWTQLPRVDIIYAHANMDADADRRGASQSGAKGLVDRRRRRRQHDQGRARRARQGGEEGRRSSCAARACRRGLVLRNNEVNDDKMGFVASGELNPPKSRVLLQLALTKTQRPEAGPAMFDEY